MADTRRNGDHKPHFINQREIARLYGGMTSQQILRWVARGEFPPPVKVIGTTRLFNRATVEKFMRTQLPTRVEAQPSSLDASAASELMS